MPCTRIGRSTSTTPWSKSMSITRSAITHCSPIRTRWYAEMVHSWPKTVFGADLDHALVTADLGAVADPDKRPKLSRPHLPICSSRPRPKKTGPSVSHRQPAGVEEAAPQIAPKEARVLSASACAGGPEIGPSRSQAGRTLDWPRNDRDGHKTSPWPSACSRGRAARWRGRSRSSRTATPRATSWSPSCFRAPARRGSSASPDRREWARAPWC